MRHKRCGCDYWVREIPGGGHGNPLQYSCLENSMDGAACWATVHRVTKSRTWLKQLGMHTHSHDICKMVRTIMVSRVISIGYFIFFFLKKFFNFFKNFILFLNFTILYWFCHISKWIRHRHTRVPHPEPSSLLPPHLILNKISYYQRGFD